MNTPHDRLSSPDTVSADVTVIGNIQAQLSGIAHHAKIRICILITQMEWAGAQKVAITQADYFHSQGHTITLCFFYDKYELIPDLRRKHDFSIINLDAKGANASRFTNLLFSLRSFWRLFQLLRTGKIDVVETMTHYSNVIGIPIAWLARVPVRISSQRNALNDFPKWFLRLDAAITNSAMVDAMIAVSEETRKYCIEVEGMNPDKVVTVTNGIAPEPFQRFAAEREHRSKMRSVHNIHDSAVVLITVARLHRQKGHEFLIQAAQQIVRAFPDTVFVLVGEGDERERIETLVKASGCSQNFRILGLRSDVPQLLSMSDIFVLPSLYEGMPNVVLEAMAAQLPVIATDVDGTAEVVVHNETGILVSKANVEALTEAMTRLIDDRSLRCSLGMQGYKRIISSFSEQVMCERYESVILEKFAEKRRICNV